MSRIVTLTPLLAYLGLAFEPGLTTSQSSQSDNRRTASYSILAYDPLTGEYGVAAASHAPLIGMNLEFFDPEAGAVVVHGGPFLQINERTLIALRDGLDPIRALRVGLLGAGDVENLQVLAVSPTGAAAFTQKRAAKHAADAVGDGFVVAGLRLANKNVVPAMKESFESSDGPLADRLLDALKAGTEAGGEEGGARSAALLVVGAGAHFATRGRLLDLRIDFVEGDAVAALERLRAQVDSVYQVN